LQGLVVAERELKRFTAFKIPNATIVVAALAMISSLVEGRPHIEEKRV